MRKRLRLGFVVLLVLAALSPGAIALEAGGEVKALWSAVLKDGSDFDSELAESFNLELFLPPLGESELRYEFLVTKPLQGLLADEKTLYSTKKLYLKHRFERLHLTLGRQPISWSFGSLLNPVDYTLGAVALNEESSSKYTDAVALYVPLNWNSGLDLVVSFPGGFSAETDRMKRGVRARLGVYGYDVTLNYVEEAPGGAISDSLALVAMPRQRMGLTAKGDVGNFGVYGAFGHYYDEHSGSSRSYLAGADWSYSLDYNTKITMQLEYLGLELHSFSPAVLEKLPGMQGSDQRLDLLAGRASYPIDDFSAVSLVSIYNLDDRSFLLGPSYRSTLPRNTDLILSASVFCGREHTLFAPGELMPRAVVSLGMSCAF
jgi:hypothetical protein